MESFYGASQGTKAEALILVRTIVAHLFKERGWERPPNYTTKEYCGLRPESITSDVK